MGIESKVSETRFRLHVVHRFLETFPNALHMRTDPHQLQGICDLLFLVDYRWAMLEVKKHEKARLRPNQEYYVKHFNAMGFARFIYPENEDEVFRDLQSTFGSGR